MVNHFYKRYLSQYKKEVAVAAIFTRLPAGSLCPALSTAQCCRAGTRIKQEQLNSMRNGFLLMILTQRYGISFVEFPSPALFKKMD
jgi:hypothetical protein